MPPRPSLTPSEIAAQKRNTKKKVWARQEPTSKVISPDIADNITNSKPQWSSKKKALECKHEFWNDTTNNGRKRAPTMTELLSAPATKSAWKIPAVAHPRDGLVLSALKGCTDQVKELLKSHKYIFPTNNNGKVLSDQPFCDEVIIDILQQSLFNGNSSIGVQSHEDFVSVLDGNDEPELPMAMIALIATITYAILMDWRSGNPPSVTYSDDLVYTRSRSATSLVQNVILAARTR
ncbi:hypothetical protein EDB19DRAFT_2038283 [Suillus lakei]|nr:hypothetical protein EDB19DRAFT_2038283 [Suillus lakei]